MALPFFKCKTHLTPIKLLSIGIKGRIFDVITNTYEDAQSCIRHNSELSTLFPCSNGVRQGENLSPLLFSIYLNDLDTFLSQSCKGITLEEPTLGLNEYIKLFTLLYADDTILLANSENDLQIALDKLYIYCDKWKLTVNTSKTKVVVFSRGKVRNIPKWRFGPDEVETTPEYTYLGIKFNYNGSFEKAMSKQVNQAKRALYSLVSKFRKLNLPYDIQCHLIDSCIIPILLYGSEVWGSSNLKQIETCHNQTCKLMLHLHKRSANCMALGELGRFNMEHLIKQRMLNFWANLINGKQSKISYQIYRMARILYDQGTYKSKWLSCIHSNLNKTGLGYIWNLDQFNVNWFKHSLGMVCKDTSTQTWLASVHENNLCSNYKQYKTTLTIEPYLTLLEKKHAINICKFRTGNHRLPITVGRHLGIDRAARLCTLCTNKSIGDEDHYLFECRFFQNERMKFLEPRLMQHPIDGRMARMFDTENVKQLTKIALFIGKIIETF